MQTARTILSQTTSRESLTDLDRAIIAELQQDGRLPFSTLAAKLGVSEVTVQRRTQQLIDEGYFKILGTVDPLYSPRGNAVIVGLKCDPPAVHQVTSAVAAIPQMRFVALVTGTYDVVCELVTFDREGMVAVLSDELTAIPGVREMNTSWVLENYKTTFRWGVAAHEERPRMSLWDHGGPLDELDEGIIRLLGENGRMSYAQLAVRLGTTESTARRRTLRLLRSGYLIVVALGNPFRLGFEEVVLLWLKVDLAQLPAVVAALEGEPAVRYLSRVAGAVDLVAEAFFPDRAALVAFMNGPMANIKGIREVTVAFELVIHKRGYLRFD